MTHSTHDNAGRDSLSLDRFVDAQKLTYDAVVSELRSGRKRTHWMWFVFPQCAGLSQSPSGRHFAIRTTAEARALLEHPVLGSRLRECCRLVLAHRGRPVPSVFPGGDHMKLLSSMTLFEAVADEPELFAAVLDAFFRPLGAPEDAPGARCPRTLRFVRDQIE